MKIVYSKDDRKALCRKYNENYRNGKDGFEGFSLRDKLALAEWQTEVLNSNSSLESVRRSYRNWLRLVVEFRKELLISESDNILTDKGKKIQACRTGRGFITWCKCGGSGKSPYGNICSHCYGKGYVIKELKEVSEDKYLEILKDKYYKKCKDKRMFPHPNAEEKDIKFFESFLNNYI